ncbi:MAG: DUF2752 domain-containing protein [Nocardioides sp.]
MTLQQRVSLGLGPDRVRRMVAPSATLGGLALLATALRLRDPHAAGSWGFCPSAVLGIWCPGCGALRGVNDITELRFAEALSSNVLLVVVVPLGMLLLGRWALDSWTGRVRAPLSQRASLAATMSALIVVVAFTVLRNLPAGSWLAP